MLQGTYRGQPLGGGPIAALLNNGHPPLLLLEGVLGALKVGYERRDLGDVAGHLYPDDMAFSVTAQGRLTLGPQTDALGPEDFRFHDQDIYVSAAVLARLLPIAFTFNTRDLTFQLKATGLLALDMAREREAARARLDARTPPDDLPLADFPYQALGRPFGDLRLGVQYSSGSSASKAYNHDALLTQELGYATGHLFLSGNHEKPLHDARLRLGRESSLGGVLGLPGVTSVWAGDVQARALPLVGGAGAARGLVVSAFPLERPSQFDQTLIEGDAPPGWDAELFRGRELVAYQRVGEDGRYAFEDVSLFFGTNSFKVVLYGPQGQRREVVSEFGVGSGMTPPGTLYWRAFAGQTGQRLLQALLPEVPNTVSEGAYMAEAELGLSQHLSALAFVGRLPNGALLNRRLQTYSGGGLNLSAGPVYLEGKVAMQDGGGQAWSFGGSTRLAGVGLSVRHADFSRFASADASRGATPLQTESSLRVSTSIPLGARSVGVYALANRWVYQNGNQERSGRLQARFSVAGLLVGQELDWRQTTYAGGNVQVQRIYVPSLSGSLADTRWSATGRYNLNNRYWEQMQWSAAHRVNAQTSASLNGSLTPAQGSTPRSHSVAVGLSRDFGPFYANVSASRSSNGAYSVGVGINLSFGVQPQGGVLLSSRPMAQQGTADVLVFADRNGNGRFDDGVDAPISDAQVRFGRSGGQAVLTDASGMALLTGLPAHRPVSVEVDPSSLDNPFLMAREGGVRFIPRLGQPFQAQLAMVDTGEISGQLQVERNGRLVGLSGVVLELLQHKPVAKVQEPSVGWRLGTKPSAPQGPGVADSNSYSNGYASSPSALLAGHIDPSHFRLLGSKQSQFDGTFNFDLVPPGQYWIRIREGQAIRGHILEAAGVKVEVTAEQLMVENAKIRLLAPLPELARPATPAEEPVQPVAIDPPSAPAPDREMADQVPPDTLRPLVLSKAFP